MRKSAEDAFDVLKAEIEAMAARAALSSEDVAHLRAIKSISFMLWYDPDNDACARYGNQLEPHIAALCKKFHIERD